MHSMAFRYTIAFGTSCIISFLSRYELARKASTRYSIYNNRPACKFRFHKLRSIILTRPADASDSISASLFELRYSSLLTIGHSLAFGGCGIHDIRVQLCSHPSLLSSHSRIAIRKCLYFLCYVTFILERCHLSLVRNLDWRDSTVHFYFSCIIFVSLFFP